MHTTMKDSLKDLLQERFQAHEAPVDPATWQVIEARLLTSAPATDHVNELFRERFQQHEVNVDPAVWQGISSQLGQGAVAAGSSFGTLGWIAAGVAGVVAIGGLIAVLNQEPRAEVAVAPEATPVTVGTEAQNPESTLQAAATTVVPKEVAPETNLEPVAAPTLKRATTATAGSTPGSSAPNVTSPSQPTLIAPSTDQPGVGAEVVNEIISDISHRVEEQVRATYREPSRTSTAVQAGEDRSTPAPQMAVVNEPEVENEVAPAPKPFMPNTFTPNNDGINDLYIVPMEGYSSLLLRVYSMKSNQLVFSTNSGEPWSGANCEDGMYLVAVEAMTTDGRLVSEGKVVWLNRSGMN